MTPIQPLAKSNTRESLDKVSVSIASSVDDPKISKIYTINVHRGNQEKDEAICAN